MRREGLHDVLMAPPTRREDVLGPVPRRLDPRRTRKRADAAEAPKRSAAHAHASPRTTRTTASRSGAAPSTRRPEISRRTHRSRPAAPPQRSGDDSHGPRATATVRARGGRRRRRNADRRSRTERTTARTSAPTRRATRRGGAVCSGPTRVSAPASKPTPRPRRRGLPRFAAVCRGLRCVGRGSTWIFDVLNRSETIGTLPRFAAWVIRGRLAAPPRLPRGYSADWPTS